MWGVLIAGSTGSALRAVCPPNLHITLGAQSDLVIPRVSGFLVSLALGHHGPGHSGHLVGQCDGCDFGRSPRQQCREPRPMPGAVDFGVADDRKRADRKQAAQIAIASFTDIAKPVLATA